MEQEKALLNRVDEDGWTVVTRAHRRNANASGGITVTAANARYTQELKPKKQALEDFYKFQLKHTKRNQLVELRKRFEEDKLKIASLRTQRRFKPY